MNTEMDRLPPLECVLCVRLRRNPMLCIWRLCLTWGDDILYPMSAVLGRLDRYRYVGRISYIPYLWDLGSDKGYLNPTL